MSDKLTSRLKNDIAYEQIVQDILNDNDFNKISEIPHHHTTNRLTHSLKVSYLSYRMAKKLNIDYVAAARSGLLHDYYFEQPCEQPNIREKKKMMLSEHTKIAVENAKKRYNITSIEEDAIRCHMFPLDKKIPKHKVSWIVMLADKLASFGDFSHSCEYVCAFFALLVINWLFN